MAKIPGLPAVHKIVTDNCRKRPKQDWVNDCVQAVEQTLLDLHDNWEKDAGVQFRVVVTVERP